ncbi:multicopper oxidase [Diaporthe eres]|nr:multicopper oxidase [Diaporthe eres]
MESKGLLKSESDSQKCAVPEAPRRFTSMNKLQLFLIVAILPAFGLWYHGMPARLATPLIESGKTGSDGQLVRSYNLSIGSRWMNQDGGRWRPMLVCNGQTPCPTLYAEEGDIVQLHVQNDLYAQSSIHWSGMAYHQSTKYGPWNDGTAGLDQGLYGLAYVAPSPSRKRPYHLITSDPLELRKIQEAERNLLRMRAEGSEFYCYDSLIVNGKGRVHCRQPGFEKLNGHGLDAKGCIQPEGLPQEKCSPSTADYEVIETDGQQYLMLNLLNSGFEHSVKVAIDGHEMIVVANDGGFVEPYTTHVAYVPSAGRITVLIKTDSAADEYAVRISSTSVLQNLQGYAILRYPGKRQPIYGQPMKLPEARPSEEEVCLLKDSTVRPHCKEVEANFLPPYPASPVPAATTSQSWRKKKDHAAADLTFRLTAGQQKSKTEPHAPEYFLNEQPWQLFRASMTPVLFSFAQGSGGESAAREFEKPIIGGVPAGAVVDLIFENTLNETVPLYKHGEPHWILGAARDSSFPYDTVSEAVRDGFGPLNLENPGLAIVHDLPPLGWTVVRFKAAAGVATMVHAVKLRMFALGMSAPILEGLNGENLVDVPEYAKSRPHVKFEPANDGVFG